VLPVYYDGVGTVPGSSLNHHHRGNLRVERAVTEKTAGKMGKSGTKSSSGVHFLLPSRGKTSCFAHQSCFLYPQVKISIAVPELKF